MKDPKGRTEIGFKKHIFICQNLREGEHPRGCCHDKGGSEIHLMFKQEIVKNNLVNLLFIILVFVLYLFFV